MIYINDLFHSSKYLSFILFADDTSIFYRHKDIQTLINTVNSELCLVSSWFKANKLTLHPDKTKFILFHPSRKKVNLDEIHISINGAPLSRVDNTKFLGVIIHQNLTQSKKKTEHLQLGTMKDSNGTYTDPSEIATKFNNFFINIGPNLANSIPPPQLSHKQFLVSHYTSSFLLSPTSALEVSSVASVAATGIVKINRHSPVLQPTSPTSLIRLVRLAFSQHPLLRFKPHNVLLKQLRHILRLNFRHCHTNSPHQITNHRQILHNLS